MSLGQNGDPGPKGVKGDMGYQGFNGTNGERGQKGNHNRMIPLACYDVSVGDKGDNGQRGDPGDRGARGFVGKMCLLHVYCTHLIKFHCVYHLKLKITSRLLLNMRIVYQWFEF